MSRVAGNAPEWEVQGPVTLPTRDMRLSSGRDAAWEYVQRVGPDALWVAWPCGPLSIMQYINMRAPAQRRRLRAKRVAAHALLQFTAKPAEYQRRRGRLFVGKNPETSLVRA